MKPSHSWIFYNTETILDELSHFLFDNQPCHIVEAVIESDGYTKIKLDGVGKKNEIVIYYSLN